MHSHCGKPLNPHWKTNRLKAVFWCTVCGKQFTQRKRQPGPKAKAKKQAEMLARFYARTGRKPKEGRSDY